MKWTMKIFHSQTLWADGTFLWINRQLDMYESDLQLTQRGKVVTVTGSPGVLTHLAAKKARDLENGYVTKILTELKEDKQ